MFMKISSGGLCFLCLYPQLLLTGPADVRTLPCNTAICFFYLTETNLLDIKTLNLIKHFPPNKKIRCIKKLFCKKYF